MYRRCRVCIGLLCISSRITPPLPLSDGRLPHPSIARVIACLVLGLSRGAMAVAWIFCLMLVPLAAGAAVQPVLEAFPLSSVRLTPGSQEALAADMNAEYLKMIDIENMLWTFRQNAGLQPVPGSQPFWGVRSRALSLPDAPYCQFDTAENTSGSLIADAELGGSIGGGPGPVHWPLHECSCSLLQLHKCDGASWLSMLDMTAQSTLCMPGCSIWMQPGRS